MRMFIYFYIIIIFLQLVLIMISDTKIKLFNIFQEQQTKSTNEFQSQNIEQMTSLLMLRNNFEEFCNVFQNIYLKISLTLIQSHKKQSQKYVNTIRQFALKLNQIKQEKSTYYPYNLKISQQQSSYITNFYLFEIRLFSDLIRSSYHQIKIFGSRLLFTLLQSIKLNFFKNSKSINVLNIAMISVLKLLKNKISTNRQQGIKLSSIFLRLKIAQCQTLQKTMMNQFLKILNFEQNQNIRSAVIKHLIINEYTLKDFIQRLRDKSIQIRIAVFKKLTNENVSILELEISYLYKILYDGINSKCEEVKNECVKYFQKVIRNRRLKIIEFVKLFKPNLLLHYPHVYQSFYILLQQFVKLWNNKQFLDFIKQLCSNLKKNIIDQGIIYLHVITNLKKQDLNQMLETYYINGIQQAILISLTFKNNQYFEFCELLKLVRKSINIDQVGKNKIFDSLCEILKTVINYQVQIPQQNSYHQNDISNKIDYDYILKNRLFGSNFEVRMIHQTNDLVFLILTIMNQLRPDYFIIEVQQIISQMNDNNGFMRQIQNLKKIIQNLQNNKENKSELLQTMIKKLNDVQKKINIVKERTFSIVLYLSLQRNWFNQQLILQVYRQNYNNIFSILLIGQYCLIMPNQIQKYFNQIWQNCIHPQNRFFFIVSLRVVTDLALKYNFLREIQLTNNHSSYNFSDFLTILVKSFFDKDKDIRVNGIELVCKILYANIICNPDEYFIYILLLWFDTNINEVTSKSVHIISVFFKEYLEKTTDLMQLSKIFQKFILIIKSIQKQNKIFNREILYFGYQYQQFIKKLIRILFKILSCEHNIEIYNEKNYNRKRYISAKQSFILFLFIQQKCANYLQNIFEEIIEFFGNANQVVLIYFKELFQQKKNTRHSWISKIRAVIQHRLNSSTDKAYLGYKLIKSQYQKHLSIIRQQAKEIIKKIQSFEILLKKDKASELCKIIQVDQDIDQNQQESPMFSFILIQ